MQTFIFSVGHPIRRVLGELCEIISGTDKTIAMMPIELKSDANKFFSAQLRGLILAPEGAPMENYVLSLSVEISQEYPFKPPKIRFENQVWHPRVRFENGVICMPELTKAEWQPKLKLETCLASIQHMLVEPFLDPTKGSLNSEAFDEYFQNHDEYNRKSKAFTMESNEGYGKIGFDDHRIASIQATIRLPQLAHLVKYKCSIFCQRKSTYTWNLILFIFPAVDIYQHHAEKHTQKFAPRLTSFEFGFKPSELSVGIPKNGSSKDKCWAIRPVSTLIVKKDECDDDPRKFNSRRPSCELSFEWIRTEIAPQRLIEKITLNGPSSELLYCVDVTVDPSNFSAWTLDLNIQTCFRKLLPVASAWENIGCLLGIPDGRLKQIKHDERSADNCLREMLNTWLKQKPTWMALAEAVKPFNECIAEELQGYDS